MKERIRRKEMKVLIVISVLALLVGTSSVWGTVVKWEQVAYASAQQAWNQANTAAVKVDNQVVPSRDIENLDGRVERIESQDAAAWPGGAGVDLQVGSGTQTETAMISATESEVEAGKGQDIALATFTSLDMKSAKAGVESVAAKTAKKTVYLTFDDGPSAHTAEVLDILKQSDIKGTFFVLGKQVTQHPKLMKRIADEGHAVGNHTYNHNYKQLYSSFKEFWSQIRQTGQAIKDVIGYEPALVRAPGGTYLNFNKQYFDLMKQAGYVVFDWNVDSGDSKRVGVPAKEILATIKQSSLADKVIVLMHDSAGHGETVKALPDIIKYYKSKGYTFDVLTADQEPVQFRVATKERWTRTAVSKAWISANVDHVKVDGRAEEPVAKPELLRFLVKSSLGDLVFESNQHMSVEEKTYVPIRSFVEQLGGSVQYDAAADQYILAFNSTRWTIDRKSGMMAKVLEDGNTEALEWHAVQERSMYWVPLRSLLEQSGGILLQYELVPIKAESSAA